MSLEAKAFSKSQEAVRKCVERVFGVLFRRFRVMFVASELLSAEKMQIVAKACIILHNMVVEQRRDSYTGDGAHGASASYNAATDATDLDPVKASAEDVDLRLHQMMAASTGLKSASEHKRLVKALVEHIWQNYGRSGLEKTAGGV
eukprot:Plantae.Rhodophyta-Palmaria_palmata.ctg14594.p1 GENE.Plantae.Rhodophyta-Palmaria_palmata.ctg14594~~Plantae.Rhodophyta-Palmaria_palmata.ctg14594.p1  ORF type:complete len:146 (+),score=19.96 Plantae.Rhodophyta-Palmaria_palmata.ctg14594:386-823(+)